MGNRWNADPWPTCEEYCAMLREEEAAPYVEIPQPVVEDESFKTAPLFAPGFVLGGVLMAE